MQDDASQLKQEIHDLKQQLLAEQVRHNQIARIYVGTVNIYQQQQQQHLDNVYCPHIIVSACCFIPFLFHFQTNTSGLKQQMMNLDQQLLEQQVCKN